MPARTVAPISRFLRGYLEAALFTETDDAEQPLDKNYDIGDFAPEAVANAKADVEAFQRENAEDLAQAGDATQNGIDFWLTRNGHGAGYWDRGYDDDVAERLTAASDAYGMSDAYVGDNGLIYLT